MEKTSNFGRNTFKFDIENNENKLSLIFVHEIDKIFLLKKDPGNIMNNFSFSI
jgi:hypothetical protein